MTPGVSTPIHLRLSCVITKRTCLACLRPIYTRVSWQRADFILRRSITQLVILSFVGVAGIYARSTLLPLLAFPRKVTWARGLPSGHCFDSRIKHTLPGYRLRFLVGRWVGIRRERPHQTVAMKVEGVEDRGWRDKMNLLPMYVNNPHHVC